MSERTSLAGRHHNKRGASRGGSAQAHFAKCCSCKDFQPFEKKSGECMDIGPLDLLYSRMYIYGSTDTE